MFYSETLFTIEKGKIKISNVSQLYCHCHLYCPLKEVFLYRNFQLEPRKVSVVNLITRMVNFGYCMETEWGVILLMEISW